MMAVCLTLKDQMKLGPHGMGNPLEDESYCGRHSLYVS